MPETTPLIKAALNLRVGAGFDVYLYGGVMVIEPGKYKVFKVLKFYPDPPVDMSQTMKQRPERL